MSRVATGDPPSAPELTMVLAGSKPAPASSWAHINAALSELIDANRQLKMGGKAARIRAGPPRLPSRTAAHFASHRPCTSRGGWHRHSTASLATPPHRTAPAPTQYPYSLPRGAGSFASRYEAFAPLAPRGAGRFTVRHEAFESLGSGQPTLGRPTLGRPTSAAGR